jgi:hypothetical protein
LLREVTGEEFRCIASSGGVFIEQEVVRRNRESIAKIEPVCPIPLYPGIKVEGIAAGVLSLFSQPVE